MTKRKHYKITAIRRSCINGKAVWISKSPSKAAEQLAYWRACKHEVERVRQWGETVLRRKSNVQRMLNGLMANLPVTDTLTEKCREAARQIVSISESCTACCSDFYNHIMEERSRRNGNRRKK